MPINTREDTMDISGLLDIKTKKASKRHSEEPSIFHISILELIPRAPKTITVRQLLEKLDVNKTIQRGDYVEEKNYIKKIQRTLTQLCDKYKQIECASKGRTNEYSWAALAEPIMFPSLDSNTALVLALASHYLAPILPEESVKSLNRLFMRAKSTLASNSKDVKNFDGVSIWKDKVAVLNSGISRELPRINPQVEKVIYQALLYEKAVQVKYKSWDRDDATEQVLSPQGLFVRGQSIYIYALNHKKIDTAEPILYLLHRIQEASIVNEDFHKIPGFNVQQHLTKSTFGVLLVKEKPEIFLKIKVDKDALKTIIEQPLSKNQKVQPENDQWSILTATVKNTLELKQWISSHGHHLEVIEPQELRVEIKLSIVKMAGMYGN